MGKQYDNIYDMTNKESGIIIYTDNSAIITNWISYNGIPRVFVNTFIALGEDLELEEVNELTGEELKNIVEDLEVFYDANNDLPELLKGNTGGKIYTLKSGEKIITPDGWHWK